MLKTDHSWHTYDADVDCNSGGYGVLWASGVIALLLIPLGVPCLFAFLLYKNRAALSATVPSDFSFDVFATAVRSLLNDQESVTDADLRAIYDEIDADSSGQVSPEELWKFALEHAIHGRKFLGNDSQPSMAEEVRASEELKEATAEQQAQRKWWEGGKDEFRFLVRAYEADAFWFELTQYGKKFILSGVLVFAQPGSTAQLYIACIVSFFFFAVLTMFTPFKNPKTDLAASIAEANLFFTILCLLMMKINLAGEFLDRDFYDSAIAASNVLAAVLPIVLASILAIHRLATEWVDSRSDPLNSGDIVRVIVCPDNLQLAGHLGKVIESDGTCKFDVEVRIRTASSLNRCSSCRRSPVEVHTQTLDRDQVQIFLGKKQTLKLVAGLCKQLFVCAKAARSQHDHNDEKQKKGADGKDVGHTVLAEVHVDHGLHGDGDEGINLKEMALDSLRSALKPALAKRNLRWEQVEPVIKAAASLSQLQDAVADPETFVTDMLVVLTPLMIRAAINKLRPQLEPVLKKQGLVWENALPALELVDTVEEIEAAVDDPEAFLRALLAASSPAARALMIAKAKPLIEPLLLKEHELPWDHVQTVLAMTDLDQIQQIIDDPEAFVETMLATVVGPAAKRLAVARLKPKILPVVQRQGLVWEDVAPALELVDTIDELEAALDDPEAFLLELAAAAGPAVKAMLIAQLRPLLEPLAVKEGLAWVDTLPIIDLISTVEQVRAAIDDPEAFVETMLATVVGPAAKRLAVARLKPKILPVVQRQGLVWEDVAPALELVDTIEELEAALDDPEAFMKTIAAAAGPAAKCMAIARLRPQLEPLLALKAEGIEWADAASVMDMISTVQQLQHAAEDPEGFVETVLATVVGPAAMKLAVAKLKPKMLPVVQRQGLVWEDVAPALELVDRAAELEAALDDPDAFLARLLSTTGPAAKRMAIARLRPQLEPLLAEEWSTHSDSNAPLLWSEAVGVIDLVASSVDDLQSAIDDLSSLELFVQMIVSATGPAAQKLLIGRLRPVLEPMLMKVQGIPWEDQALPALERFDDLSVLEAGLRDPESLVRLLVAGLDNASP